MGAYQIVTSEVSLSPDGIYETWTLSAPEGTVPVSAGIKTTSLGSHANSYARIFESYPDGCDWKITTVGLGFVVTATLYLICLTVYTITPEACDE